jgi:hypothetical protein
VVLKAQMKEKLTEAFIIEFTFTPGFSFAEILE